MKDKNTITISWKPDRTSDIPAYQQIVDFMLSSVSSGAFEVGMKLPSQRKLSQLFEVNRSTVNTALDELAAYGIIRGSFGGGTEIVSNTWSVLLKSNQNWSKRVLSGNFKENSFTLQQINQLEFDSSLLRLGTGELSGDLFPVKSWQHSLERVAHNVTSLGYLEPLGLYELRAELVTYLEKMGIHTTADGILITSGSLQALQLISVCLLKSGSQVFVEAPSYLKSLQVFQSAGHELIGIPMDNEGIEYWKILRQVKNAPAVNSPVIYTIPTNHNPTGICMSSRRRQELLEFCLKNRLPIIEDGAYQELCYQNDSYEPIKKHDKSGMVIYIGTASKTLSPGLRIGWIVAPEAVVKRLSDVKMQMDYGASSISQYVFLEFLKSGMYEDYLVFLKGKLRLRLSHALSVLEKYFKDLALWHKPCGGFYIWLTFRFPIKTEQLFNEAIKEGILLNPGDIYDFKANNSLRLSYAYISETQFEKGVLILRKLVQKLFVR